MNIKPIKNQGKLQRTNIECVNLSILEWKRHLYFVAKQKESSRITKMSFGGGQQSAFIDLQRDAMLAE